MDYKKTNAPTNTVTRNLMELCEDTGNIYETVSIIGKRANQIAAEMKNDLSKKLQEFASYNDNLEEVFESREQIEISRYYEKLPKPTLIATQEYIEGKVYYRNPAKERKNCSNPPIGKDFSECACAFGLVILSVDGKNRRPQNDICFGNLNTIDYDTENTDCLFARSSYLDGSNDVCSRGQLLYR